MGGSRISTTAIVSGCRQGQLRIDVAISSGCGGCAQKSTCAPVGAVNSVVFDLASTDLRNDRVSIGTSVAVSVGTAVFARFVVLCYLVPAVLMLVGAHLGQVLMSENSDLWALAGAGTGLVVGCAVLRLYDSRVSHPVRGKRPRSDDRKFPVSLTVS